MLLSTAQKIKEVVEKIEDIKVKINKVKCVLSNKEDYRALLEHEFYDDDDGEYKWCYSSIIFDNSEVRKMLELRVERLNKEVGELLNKLDTF